MKKLNVLIPLLTFLVLFLIFFSPLILSHKLPLPADIIYGLYHPWRDAIAQTYPNGLAFKNFLVTDPVRQQYVWRNLAVQLLARGQLPLWNPYSFSGTPLWANIQSAPFYPLNILYIFGPATAWTLQIMLQTALGFVGMFLFLRRKNLSDLSSTIGALAWVGSGFFVAWLSLNTLVQSAVYLPLIFLGIDSLIFRQKLRYALLIALWLTLSFLAGALQIFFYVVLASVSYLLWNYRAIKRKTALLALLSLFIFFLITAPQWLAFLRFLPQSARTIDASDFLKPGWFLPWQNLVQLFAPDYFGNPATLNYFGVWNYMEFLPYIGLLPLSLVFLALTNKLSGDKWFFLGLLLVSCLFALPNFISLLPYQLSLPLISSVQPTRLVVLIDFSLAVLAAFGAEAFIKNLVSKKSKIATIVFFSIIFALLWLVALLHHQSVSIKNLYLPTALYTILIVLYLIPWGKRLNGVIILVTAVTILDLSRVFLKFEPFSSGQWLFGQTKITTFLTAHTNLTSSSRIAALDDRIFPPNFSVNYSLPFVSGYDSLALRRYLQLVAAIERNSSNISEPYGFNRIVVPKNYRSKLFSLLGVKYLLTFEPIDDTRYKLVFREGQTNVYQYLSPIAKAYIARSVLASHSPQQSIQLMYDPSFVPGKSAVVEGSPAISNNASGTVEVKSQNSNDALLTVTADKEALVVLDEIYYSAWQAEIDGKPTVIYPANLAFRGVIVPPGKHTVHFFVSL